MASARPSTVRVGGMSPSQLREALREQGVELNAAAEELFRDSRFTTLEQPREIAIAVVSVVELGFAEGATPAQILARALESGLAECPLETGPHLRLQYLAQIDVVDPGSLTHGRAPPGSITVMSPPTGSPRGTRAISIASWRTTRTTSANLPEPRGDRALGPCWAAKLGRDTLKGLEALRARAVTVLSGELLIHATPSD